MIYLNQAAAISLIYTYRATNGKIIMISCNEVREFEKIVNENLKKMNSKVYNLTPDYLIDKDELFFTYQTDIEGNGYYVLKNDNNSINNRKRYIMSMPLDIILASQKTNALESINLIMIDGKMINKDYTTKVLSLNKIH